MSGIDGNVVDPFQKVADLAADVARKCPQDRADDGRQQRCEQADEDRDSAPLIALSSTSARADRRRTAACRRAASLRSESWRRAFHSSPPADRYRSGPPASHPHNHTRQRISAGLSGLGTRTGGASGTATPSANRRQRCQKRQQHQQRKRRDDDQRHDANPIVFQPPPRGHPNTARARGLRRNCESTRSSPTESTGQLSGRRLCRECPLSD